MAKGFGCMFAGTEGVGKTSVALEFPKKLDMMSMSETGTEDLIDMGVADDKYIANYNIEDYEELVHRIRKSEAATLVLDSVSGLQKILFKHSCAKDYGNNWDEFLDYYKGPRQNVPLYAETICTELENKRRKGVHVIVIAHVKVETMTNPKGLDYKTYDIDCDEGMRSVLKKFMANILFMDLDPGTERVTKTLKGKAIEAQMKEGDIRVFFTQKSMTHTAKNKMNLPPVVSMGNSPQEAYDTLVSHLPQVYKEQLV